MPRPALLLAILLALTAALAGCATEPSARSLGRCPNGHATLRNVPILYGYHELEGPEGEKLRQSLERGEVRLGGCVTTRDDPSRDVVCTTCGYEHSIGSTRRRDGSWERKSPDVSGFRVPISEKVLSFPGRQVEPLEKPLAYEQTIGDNGKVQNEGLQFISTQPPRRIKAVVDKWLERRGIRFHFTSESRRNLNGSRVENMEWRMENHSGYVMLYAWPPDNASLVMVDFSE